MRYFIRRVALALAAVMSLLAPTSRAQSNTFVVEAPIQAIPIDLEVTPNGKLAVVRASLPLNDNPSDWKLSFWDTRNGAQVLPNVQGTVGRGNLPVNASTDKPMFCNAIAVTSSAVLALGSADTQAAIPGEISAEDTTYVDYMAVRYNQMTGDPEVYVTHQYALLDPNPTASTQMGGVHDVEVTPDGSFAVVSHNNWVHIFDMSTGLLVYQHNTGGNGPCTALYSRNSVEVTNTRAVVITGRRLASGRFETDFHVFALSATPTRLGGGTVPHQADPLGTWDFGPHDLAITPNGDRVVIAANRSVQLYNITSMADQGAYVDNYDTRRWQIGALDPTASADLWDSLEVSNTRAVVISNRLTTSGGSYSADGWGIRVFDISWGVNISNQYPQSLLWSYDAASSGYSSPGNDPAWDVAMASDGLQATVKSQIHDMALLDVVTPLAGTGSFISLGGGNPIGTQIPASSGVPGVNDATVLLAPDLAQEPSHRWAAFTGSAGGQVRVFLLDLANGPWQQSSPSWNADLFTEANGTGNMTTADVALTLDQTGLVVRQSAPVDDSGSQGGVDWMRYKGVEYPTSPKEGVSWGGRGVCTAADSLKIGRFKAVSISRDPDFQSYNGWIHIVKAQ